MHDEGVNKFGTGVEAAPASSRQPSFTFGLHPVLQSCGLVDIGPSIAARHWSQVRGAILALLAHAGLIALIVHFSLDWHQTAQALPRSLPVELVTIADKTGIAPTAEEITSTKGQVPQPPQAISPAATILQPDAAAEPTKPSALIIMATPATADRDNLPDDARSALTAAPRNTQLADRTIKGTSATNAATLNFADALRAQIKPCWALPGGLSHPEDLAVDFDLVLNPDGSVAQPPQLTADSASRVNDPRARAAAEAARHAIYTCAPYKLPPARYVQWHEINPFHVDPRQMIDP